MMQNTSRFICRTSAAAMVALCFFASEAVAAASQDSADEIIVTAQKREQRLQDVPIAINAFSGAALKESSIKTLHDLPSITPSLVVYSTSAGASDTTLKIRGIGTTGNNAGLEQAVGVFIDGVYRNRAGLALGQLQDIERVEVLRGPQSTLFGKNTSAGAISVITQKPTSVQEGFVESTLGERNLATVDGTWNQPVSSKLNLRFNGGYARRDGFIENRNNRDEDLNTLDRFYLRGQALWTPTEKSSLRLIADYWYGKERCCGATTVAMSGADRQLVNTLETLGGVSPSTPSRQDFSTSINDPAMDNKFHDYGVSAEYNLEITPKLKLTNILAWRDYEQKMAADLDYTGAQIFYANTFLADKVLTEELRFSGKFDNVKPIDSIDYIFGGFYSNENIKNEIDYIWGNQAGNFFCADLGGVGSDIFGAGGNVPQCFLGSAAGNNVGGAPGQTVLGGFINPNFFRGLGTQGHFNETGNTYSPFAQVTFNITPKLAIAGGIRYIRDEKSASGRNAYGEYGTFDSVIPAFLGLVNDFNGKVADDALTGNANIQYKFSRELMTYFSWAHGYKSGGFNLDRSAASLLPLVAVGFPPLRDPSFKPERSDAFEVGFKSSFDHGRYTLNGALFHEKFTSLQVLTFNGLQFLVDNAKGAIARGFELEGAAKVDPHFTLNAGVTFSEAHYTEGVVIFGTNLSNRPLVNAPRWQGTVGATYTRNFNATEIDWFLHGDLSYRSAVYTNIEQQTRQDGFGLFNLRAGFTGPDSKWQLAAFCTNCADKRYYQVIFARPFAVAGSDAFDGFVGDPRQFGVVGSVKF